MKWSKADWHERGFMEVGSVPADWRHQRRAVRAEPAVEFPFLDVEDPATIQHLREELAEVLALHGYADLDVGLIRGRDRRITRAISHWAFHAEDEHGEAAYGGIRYCSRQGTDYECWAVFGDLDLERLEDLPIPENMPALQRVAELYELVIH